MASFWDWVPALITAGAVVYGADKATSAQKQAAATATTAQNAATAAQLKGINVATTNDQNMQQQASPGLMANQAIIARGTALTPEQKQAVSDAQRTTIDSLNGGSLRGSARATTAAVNDINNKTTAQFMQTNQNNVDEAANALSGQYFNAGNNISNLNSQAGNTVSQGLINTGQTAVNSGLNESTIQGQAVGDVGAVIADQLKKQNQAKRDSSYASTANGAAI